MVGMIPPHNQSYVHNRGFWLAVAMIPRDKPRGCRPTRGWFFSAPKHPNVDGLPAKQQKYPLFAALRDLNTPRRPFPSVGLVIFARKAAKKNVLARSTPHALSLILNTILRMKQFTGCNAIL